ncbi:trafficking protein particle complex subunit 12-like [Zingiber officinale]|uniref:Trafficking protein particle complex subunit 12 n=1 Tax=Zingiber officinale TaxID=94328 RepID=A0A8J5HN05_ZINOF|nr:trafficking protein particle complex subunit 12-like [Zingiber officinale]XP_042466796.1 trafficking protein particle complex subunit 12-like [Zingiber officinale]KAG6531262.1 hypothetical protein ZIOFF_005066 [Zingiber officinale]
MTGEEPDAGRDPPSVAIADPLLSPPTSPLDLPFDVPSLLALSRRGQWRAVLDAVAVARRSHGLLPHHHLVCLAVSALALSKLRRFSDAAAEIDALDAPLDSPRFRFESYPSSYPGRSGSMVPFALRFLHADLPQRLGTRSVTVDRLYALFDLVRSKILEETTTASADLWRRREVFVIASLCCNHFVHREFEAALALVRLLLERDPSDPLLLSRLGYVQLQIGDLTGAKASFARLENLHPSGERTVELENLVGRNKALEFIVVKDYAAAVREYEECIERDPADVVALNNKALCLMYSRDLSDSIKVLEGALERVPTAALNETLVVNLCSMYELAYVNHGDVKKTLSNWIAQVAPDDFDPSCTRI